jgi:hypothetical protein
MRLGATLCACLLFSQAAAAQEQATTVTWGAFIDAYYAYHFNLSAPADAPLITQPVRHNEFNINLAHMEAKVSAERVRGRFALQMGTSVSANYAGEPTSGSNSGPLLGRHVQEAIVGYRLADHLWIDGGIFLSHIGAESWISRDNWTYTRSLIAEYSPYYETGVKATWTPSGKFSGTIALLNGWQNISETNGDKAGGIRLDYTPSSNVTVSYSNFLGNEAPEDAGDRLRFFHDFIVKLTPSDRLGFLASFDVGTQGDDVTDIDASWWGFTTILRYQASPEIGVAGRFERYSDPDGVFITTAAGPGIETNGVSFNIDITPGGNFLWRTEFRTLLADDDVFTDSDGAPTSSSPFLVTSLAVTL